MISPSGSVQCSVLEPAGPAEPGPSSSARWSLTPGVSSLLSSRPGFLWRYFLSVSSLMASTKERVSVDGADFHQLQRNMLHFKSDLFTSKLKVCGGLKRRCVSS